MQALAGVRGRGAGRDGLCRVAARDGRGRRMGMTPVEPMARSLKVVIGRAAAVGPEG